MHNKTEHDFPYAQVYMLSQAGGMINAAAERQRSPYEVADALHHLSNKYAGPSQEHCLLREAALVIGKLINDEHCAVMRADQAERSATYANSKMKLARLALDAVHVDG